MAKRRGPGLTLIQRSRQKGDEEKALYHQVVGAGRRRTLRKFLGLTEADQAAIEKRLRQGIQQNLKKAQR